MGERQRVMAAQVALKRQQAAEDAIALGIRVMATGESFNYLPAGPILGLPLAMQAQEQHSNADRRIREVEMFRQQKLGEEERSIAETDQKNISERMEVEEMKTASKSVVEAATSSSNTPKEQTEQVETCPSKSPRPDVVSST